MCTYKRQGPRAGAAAALTGGSAMVGRAEAVCEAIGRRIRGVARPHVVQAGDQRGVEFDRWRCRGCGKIMRHRVFLRLARQGGVGPGLAQSGCSIGDRHGPHEFLDARPDPDKVT
jgi:hypothetical protein